MPIRLNATDHTSKGVRGPSTIEGHHRDRSGYDSEREKRQNRTGETIRSLWKAPRPRSHAAWRS
jgi:hypothetical protein